MSDDADAVRAKAAKAAKRAAKEYAVLERKFASWLKHAGSKIGALETDKEALQARIAELEAKLAAAAPKRRDRKDYMREYMRRKRSEAGDTKKPRQ